MTPHVEHPKRKSVTGLLLRVGVFALLEILGLTIFPFLMSWSGLMVAAALGTFAAAAVATNVSAAPVVVSSYNYRRYRLREGCGTRKGSRCSSERTLSGASLATNSGSITSGTSSSIAVIGRPIRSPQ